MKKCLVILMLTFVYNFSFGQNIETDRPDQTESSAAVPKGSVQLESGIGFERTGIASEGLSNSSFTLPTSLFRVALINKFELRLVNTLRYDKQSDGLGNINSQLGIDNIEIGFKWQWTDGDEWKPQLALMSHLVIPSGNTKSKTYGLVNKLLISHDITDRVSIGYNLGHVYFGSGNSDFVYSAAIGFSITEKVGFYVENYGSLIDLSVFDSSVDAGFTYLFKSNIQLDYSFGFGLHERMNYQAIGISMRSPN